MSSPTPKLPPLADIKATMATAGMSAPNEPLVFDTEPNRPVIILTARCSEPAPPGVAGLCSCSGCGEFCWINEQATLLIAIGIANLVCQVCADEAVAEYRKDHPNDHPDPT